MCMIWVSKRDNADALLGCGGFAEQDSIRFIVTTDDSEPLSIRRPVKLSNYLGGEIRNRVTGRAVERLQPDIPDAAFFDSIGNKLSVWSELA